MSGHAPGAPTGRSVPGRRPRLTLDIERVLGVRARQAIRAEFLFDPAAPLVVSVEFVAEGGPRVLWRIGRDLLQEGLYSMSGLGDVRVWPAAGQRGATARMQLASGDTAALFELPVPPLAAWLTHTYELVPAGEELADVDWDVTAADLLHGPRAHSD
ncbi:SsgA family sporulation/cell division regulator [Streptomyces sp. NPDC001904]|uniref:SsgA family sporulation/cell division regulator n=1 Tax=Streptomyces sp. NPDC001904 TaxID=3154531 RepID=UPI00331A68C2